MPVPAHPSGAFGLDALPRHVAEAVWRGAEVGSSSSRTVSTGFAALDSLLPGGGWPTHTLTELLLPQAALCEWRLLGPSVPSFLDSGGRVYLIAPPKQPHVGGLIQLGLTPDQVVWIHASAPVDRLWITEQLVKSDPAGAVLAWLPQARPEQIRRLQIHAQSCDAPVFLLRPITALNDASPAPLRVAVSLAPGWQLEVRIPKRRGGSLEDALYLEAMPASLAAVIPPRLRVPQAIPVARSHKEASDARALGRVAPDPFARQSIAH
ncbi:translesion DNA synthesis-associated protein ImuA [Acidovorax sp. GBBC 1281]|uniref:translesion DNA synthesis-associated protein ImuA n=1 Tax=Acidovorax sp. GBBC 1281 TaxID=2940492 RepID=UPI00234BBE61|nr:translesion DNA synthesis-associated protein ImuA [Acidovorax sp. GBBC 1281]WCM95497.1 translesion DNA synthesis-associated protein ImuA [Acidovorax sp. GBBC 1281]